MCPTYNVYCSDELNCGFKNENFQCSIKTIDKQLCPICGKILKIRPVLCENGPIFHNPCFHGINENGDE